MNLIDRYLTAVGQRVPERVRSEVQAELRASIEDELEARGTTVHDEPAVVEILKSLGKPDHVAAAYYPAGQYLIGPEWYPVFRKVVAITLTLQLLLAAGGFAYAGFTVGMSSTLGESLLTWIGWALRSMAVAVGVIVLVFAGLQRAATAPDASKREWHPQSLPTYRDYDVASRAESAFGLVMTGVVMVIINDVANSLRSDLPAAFQPLLARLFDRNLWLLNLGLVAFVIIYVVLLLQGVWRWYTRTARRIAEVVAVFVCVDVAVALAAQRAELQTAGLGPTMINVLVYSAIVTAVVTTGIFAWHEWSELRAAKGKPPAGTASRMIAA